MMRTSHTAVLERYGAQRALEAFHSEPYEVGWAAEARWFLRVERAEGGPWLVQVEISPDGAQWTGLGDPVPVAGVGLTTGSVGGFGSWLRVRVEHQLPTQSADLDFVLYLTLKS